MRITGRDATRWNEGSLFDRILVDVPCSSERHLIFDAWKRKAQVNPSQWSPSRCKRYASQQLSILRSAVNAAKPGAVLVYSTCSIASVENEMVIRKLVKKFGSQLEVLDVHGHVTTAMLRSLGAEFKDPGWIILPDSSKFGPIYWAILRKKL